MAGLSGGLADRQRLLAAIGSALGMTGPYRESPRPGSDAEPPGHAVVAGAIEESTGRVAWIEETTLGPSGYPSFELTINVAGGRSPAWRTDLYTYNPYFGANVHLIRFFGDIVIVIYTDKHGPLVVRAVPVTGQHRTIGIGRYFALKDDLLVHTHPYEDVVRHISLREMTPAVPLPIPPPAERPDRIELSIGDGSVRWTHHLLRDEAGRREWRADRTGLLRLPDPGQRGFPADRKALWARLRELLEVADAPADGPDILIAAVGLLFWLPGEDWMRTTRRSSTPSWFVTAYYFFLRDSVSAGQAAEWLAWLDRVATGPGADPQGWDPAWSALEGAAQLALAHIRLRAARLAQDCRNEVRPGQRLLPDWPNGRWEHPVPLTEFPEGFVRAWERVPPRFLPGLLHRPAP